jgi:hypothetical protein
MSWSMPLFLGWLQDAWLKDRLGMTPEQCAAARQYKQGETPPAILLSLATGTEAPNRRALADLPVVDLPGRMNEESLLRLERHILNFRQRQPRITARQGALALDIIKLPRSRRHRCTIWLLSN